METQTLERFGGRCPTGDSGSELESSLCHYLTPPGPPGGDVYVFVVYYESLKRALKTKTIYGYRCDERLKTDCLL